jgi:anti-anti-sigma regulatory factor
MTEDAPDRAESNDSADLGPLTLTQQGNRWCFTITAPAEIMLELPRDYEHFLSKSLQRLTHTAHDLQVEMDLHDLPGLSSRQLGLMLALQKALADHCDRLHLTGVSPGVRRLLNLTRTVQFFDID